MTGADHGHRAPQRGTIHVATFTDAPEDANVAIVADALAEHGDVVAVPISLEGAVAALGTDDARTFGRFQHTPRPLVDAWLAARAVRMHVPSGSIVVMSDAGGRGGILALDEAARPEAERRRVWTVAGSSTTLRTLLVAGTVGHLGMPEASVVDWELVQYRSSDEVLATSTMAIDLLGGLGVDAELVVSPDAGTLAANAPSRPGTVWIPGPVSRDMRTGEILRGLATEDVADIAVSAEDRVDEVWNGTTWDTLAGIRRTLGGRLRRLTVPPHGADLVVIGATLTPPDDDTVELRSMGATVAVPRGSVSAAMWPDAPTWEGSDDLAALASGRVREADGRSDGERHRWSGPGPRPPEDATRARRVSVGVPVYGSVAFLDACVESVLGQTVAPHEVILMDDGSASAEVDAALDRWSSHPSGRVRTMRQPNRGVCVARNRMIAAMTGDAFVLIDQDDVMRPTFIERTGEAMRRDPDLLAVATWTEFFGAYEAIEAKPPFDRRVGVRENPIVSTAALVDVRVRDLGIAFAPDLAFLYCEDWHVWSQIVAAGGRIGLVPEPLVAHRVHHASGGFQRTDRALAIGTARATEPLR